MPPCPLQPRCRGSVLVPLASSDPVWVGGVEVKRGCCITRPVLHYHARINPLSLLDLNPRGGNIPGARGRRRGGVMAGQLSLAPGWSGAGVKCPLLWWKPLGGGDLLAALPRAVEESRGCALAMRSGVGSAAGAGCLVSLAMSVPNLSHTGHTYPPGAACASCHKNSILVPSPEHLEQPEPPVPGPCRCRFSELAG